MNLFAYAIDQHGYAGRRPEREKVINRESLDLVVDGDVPAEQEQWVRRNTRCVPQEDLVTEGQCPRQNLYHCQRKSNCPFSTQYIVCSECSRV